MDRHSQPSPVIMNSNAAMLTQLQYQILKRIAPHESGQMSGEAYQGMNKTEVLLGKETFRQLKGKVVIDFGCGTGKEAIELAQSGAERVIGIDIREKILQQAQEAARRAGVQARCEFCLDTQVLADFIVSLDSFEHFNDPAAMLDHMWTLLKPGGALLASFGPVWYHPYGGHLFSIFPWAHLIFSERALIRWRADIRSDGARSFKEVAGGLNQMTIRRFHQLVQKSRFSIEYFQTVPIRKLKAFHNRFTEEFTTSLVRCKLVKPESAGTN